MREFSPCRTTSLLSMNETRYKGSINSWPVSVFMNERLLYMYTVARSVEKLISVWECTWQYCALIGERDFLLEFQAHWTFSEKCLLQYIGIYIGIIWNFILFHKPNTSVRPDRRPYGDLKSCFSGKYHSRSTLASDFSLIFSTFPLAVTPNLCRLASLANIRRPQYDYTASIAIAPRPQYECAATIGDPTASLPRPLRFHYECTATMAFSGRLCGDYSATLPRPCYGKKIVCFRQ